MCIQPEDHTVWGIFLANRHFLVAGDHAEVATGKGPLPTAVTAGKRQLKAPRALKFPPEVFTCRALIWKQNWTEEVDRRKQLETEGDKGCGQEENSWKQRGIEGVDRRKQLEIEWDKGRGQEETAGTRVGQNVGSRKKHLCFSLQMISSGLSRPQVSLQLCVGLRGAGIPLLPEHGPCPAPKQLPMPHPAPSSPLCHAWVSCPAWGTCRDHPAVTWHRQVTSWSQCCSEEEN